jgi:hypothetical protein
MNEFFRSLIFYIREMSFRGWTRTLKVLFIKIRKRLIDLRNLRFNFKEFFKAKQKQHFELQGNDGRKWTKTLCLAWQRSLIMIHNHGFQLILILIASKIWYVTSLILVSKMLSKNKDLHGWTIKYLIIHFMFPDENEMLMTV